ncbi:putative DNA endonuclease SmrA [Rhodobacteraceae bacterium THAF1]|uniref:Smr/MutS family protein n=1 Tax=Palleronia sp. THAF1 TaxID=2587842 RepID=UPI000F3F584E|nr:Smr/MutS family protein [Palleronia sp. THAF1]QFU10147.1 putative DNA endonuclease SmrA [Palleronia sp. THAF1]VDC16948.1 putative DNA endonuclease SmrA [Rhodobacteraceae bacterium THAF1]
MARRRDLRPDERELWDRVERSAKPLHPPRRVEMPKAPAPRVHVHPEQPKADLSRLTMGARSAPGNDIQPSLSHSLAHQPLTMDAKAHKRLKQGKIVPEGRIDLHGLTLAEAHPRLMSFVFSSHAAGKRLVLVITGKGRDRDDGGPIPERRGVLRHQVPAWLTGGPLRPIVLQITEAHRRHGGSGAFYVYLRRK